MTHGVQVLYQHTNFLYKRPPLQLATEWEEEEWRRKFIELNWTK